MPDRSWMSFKMPFVKYRGDTLGMIRSNDQGYLVWLSEQVPNKTTAEAIAECKKAVAYINEVDPMSRL